MYAPTCEKNSAQNATLHIHTHDREVNVDF